MRYIKKLIAEKRNTPSAFDGQLHSYALSALSPEREFRDQKMEVFGL